MKEFELIEYIKKFFKSDYIGDDAFYLDNILITKDILVEGIHFILKDNFYEIGAKSIIANVSDILAMGGVPKFFFMGLGIPEKINFKNLELFLKGVYDFSKKYNLTLGGGDTSKSKENFFISITVLGNCLIHPIKRSGAEVGDLIFVTGELGDSEIGLRIIRDNFECEEKDYFVNKHYIQDLYPDFVIEIVKNKLITSMIDISDGFLQDLEHILNMSGKSAIVYADKIPVSDNFKRLKCLLSEEDYNTIPLISGEEYSLIFTSPKQRKNEIFSIAEKFKVKVTVVGEIVEKKDKLVYLKNLHFKLNKKGYSHF